MRNVRLHLLLVLPAVFFQGCRAFGAGVELFSGFVLWSLFVPAGVAAALFLLGAIESAVIARVRGVRFLQNLVVVLGGTLTTFAMGVGAPFVVKGLSVDLDWIDTPSSWPFYVETAATAFPTIGVVGVLAALAFGSVVTLVLPWFSTLTSTNVHPD